MQKRDYIVAQLKQLGFMIDEEPQAAFYVWCNLENLPEPLRDGHAFFLECLKEKVITVPGIFFDVNPGKRRLKKHSRYQHYVRISFGPCMDTLKIGVAGIQRVLNKFK